MLDINLIRKEPERIKKALAAKQADPLLVDNFLQLDEKWRTLTKQFDDTRAEQRKIRSAEEGKSIKETLKNPKDYTELAQEFDLIDTERAAKISGSRFGYLKGPAALMEFALVDLAMKALIKREFIPIIPPVIINEDPMWAMGYLERGRDEIYHLPQDNQYLIGTSEQSVGPMHQGEVLEDLPKRYVAFSTCFRREAGSYGKDTKGILRVHQFDKVEMVVFTTPEESEKEHQRLLGFQRALMDALELPYRVLNICSGDLGDPAAAKYDIEAWLP